MPGVIQEIILEVRMGESRSLDFVVYVRVRGSCTEGADWTPSPAPIFALWREAVGLNAKLQDLGFRLSGLRFRANSWFGVEDCGSGLRVQGAGRRIGFIASG